MFSRRSFLKSASVLGAGAAAMLGSTQAITAFTLRPRVNRPVGLTGRVASGTVGIPDVIVTDGFHVVRTDREGRYAFVSSAAAEFVYISLPRGYAFPEDSGMAQFFRRILAREGRFNADFSLERLQTDDYRHNFVVWADPQIASEQDARELKNGAAADLKNLVAAYPEGTLFHGIGCGDLVWDRFFLIDHYQEAVQIAGIPFFNVVGNHDLEIDATDSATASAMFRQRYGPTYYSFNRGAIHYVVLDDVFVVGGERKYMGLLPEVQLEWLRKDLAHVPAGTTVVVCLHIPTDNAAARRQTDKELLNNMVQNRQHLYEILAPYKVHLISGHTHINEKWEAGNIMEHVHGAVCGAWWTGPVCADGTPNGYGVFEATGSELNWYHKSTGFDRDHQVRLYERNSDPGKPGAVVANVWNWDETWQVEWFEEDVAMGSMTRYSGLDPLAVQLLRKEEMPPTRRFVAPAETEHLFYAQPSSNATKIRVVATDRFGQQYTSALVL